MEGIDRLWMPTEFLPTSVGNREETTFRDFPDLTQNLFGEDPPIVFEPLPQDDPKRRCPDITKAKRILKWEPKVGLEEGLKLTLAYFKEVFHRRGGGAGSGE